MSDVVYPPGHRAKPEPARPRYRFIGREPRRDRRSRDLGLTDYLVWQNRADPHDRIVATEWWFWRLWRFHPANKAHPLYEGPR